MEESLTFGNDTLQRQINRRLEGYEERFDSMLESSQKALSELTTSHGKYIKASSKSLIALEEQADELKAMKSSLDVYQKELKKVNITLTEDQAKMLKKMKRELSKAIRDSNNVLVENADSMEQMLKAQRDLSQRVQKGLKSNLESSDKIWARFEKSRLSSSKKRYADMLEEEARAMSDRLSWMSEYYETYHDKLTEEELEFFDEEYKIYKQRAEELEDLVKLAGAEITNSVSSSINNLLDRVRDIAIVSAAQDALGNDIDSYIENKHQLLARTGANFDYKTYRGQVNNAPLESNILSRNEYSEIYSDIVKETRMQNMNEVSYFAQDMAEQFKAYGLSAGSLDRIMWADKNSGMQNQSYRKISNIAAALEDNENLYVDATKLLSSINENIDSIAWLQYEDRDTYEKMYKSIATIEAISESSAVKGTEELMSSMMELEALSSNAYDLRDNELAKQLIAFTSATDYEDLAQRMQTPEEMTKLITEYQNYFKGMDEATLYAYAKSGQTPWNTVAEMKGFINDDLSGYIENAITTANEAAASEESLTGGKAQSANTWMGALKNTMSGIFGRVGDVFGELDVNALNLAAKLTVIRSSIDMWHDLKDSKLWGNLLDSAFGKGVGNFFSGVTAGAGNALSSIPSLISSSASSLLSALGPLVLIAALLGTIALAAKLSEKSDIRTEELYKDVKIPNNASKSENLKGKEGNKTYNIKDVVEGYHTEAEDKGTDLLAGSVDDSQMLADLAIMGWVTLEDSNGDGAIDSHSWVGKVYDSESMGILREDFNDPSTWKVYDAFNGHVIDPINGQTDEIIPGYAKGLSNVPNNGFAYLHQGEAVLTKSQAVNARADGGIKALDRLNNHEFEEDTVEGLYSSLFILKSIRDILSESALQDEEYYKDEKKERKKGSGFSSGSSGSFLSNLTGGLFGGSSVVGSVANTVSDTFNNVVDTVVETVKGSSERTSNTNSLLGTTDDFRVQDLGSWSMPNVDDLNDWIASVAPSDSPFIGKAQAFLNAAGETGLDPRYLIAHAGLESGWGTDYKALASNNYYGYGAFDSNVSNMYKYSYDSLEDGILGIASKIANGYYNKGQKSLYQMRWNNGVHQYATDELWDTKIAEILSTAPENTEYKSVLSEYAQGTPWVSSDQVAVIHQGEMIVPAGDNPFNSPIAGMMGSDNSDVVEIVRWMVSVMSSKFDAILGNMSKSNRASVPFNSDMAYIYSR